MLDMQTSKKYSMQSGEEVCLPFPKPRGLYGLPLNYKIMNFSMLPPLQLYTKTCIIYKVVHNSILQRQLNVKMGASFQKKRVTVHAVKVEILHGYISKIPVGTVTLFQEWCNIIDRFLDRFL